MSRYRRILGNDGIFALLPVLETHSCVSKTQASQDSIKRRKVGGLMRHPLCTLVVIFTLGSVEAAELEGASSLHLKITRDGNFEVLSARSKSYGVSVLFGLVGAGVASASKGGRDNEREKAISSEALAANCRAEFERALYDHLENNSYVVDIDPSERSPSLEIEIVACGFRVVDRRKDDLAAFFEAKYRFTRPGVKRAKKSQRLFQMGEFRGEWMDFERSPTLAADEFQQVLARAGQKLANRIIYSKGR